MSLLNLLGVTLYSSSDFGDKSGFDLLALKKFSSFNPCTTSGFISLAFRYSANVSYSTSAINRFLIINKISHTLGVKFNI